MNVPLTLRDFSLPLDFYHAKGYLLWMRSLNDYLVAYRHYFPDDYTRSMEQVECGLASLLPIGDKPYSTHEAQFLTLVNEHLFPLPLEYMLDETTSEDRYLSIPVEPFGVDRFENFTYDEMDLEWRLLYYLFGMTEPEDFDDLPPGAHPAVLFALPLDRGSVDDDALLAVCAQEQEPLAFLRYAVEMIDHDTGTTWLDATMEMTFTDAYWRIDIMDMLTEEYQEALTIQKKAEQFIHWLAEDLLTHFKEVIRVWNTCQQQSKQETQEHLS